MSVAGGSGGNQQQTEAELSDPVLLSFRFGQEQAKNVLRDTFKCCNTDDERMDVIERTRAIVLKLIKAEMKYTASCAQIGVVMEELQNEEQLSDENIIQDVAKIEEICLQRAAQVERELTEDRLKDHFHFKNFLELIEKIESERRTGTTPRHVPATPQQVAEVERSPGGEPQEEIIPITDPITKQSLNDPVRNKHCGHIYGKAAILELVRKNPHIRCPTIGCNNRNYIKKSDLVYDPVLAAKVNKKQRDAAKKKIELQKQQEQQQQHRHHHSPRHRHHRSPN